MSREAEAFIEKKVCEYAKSKGWLVYKFVSPSNRGVPDRILIRHGIVLFIEFKAPGARPTRQQNRVITRLKNEKMKVYVVDDVVYGQQVIDAFEK